ncbi:hypothetical protein [Halorhabdus sp. BNX81]|uniref:COG1470 family protein n=1 Tax=Halorhabdus sp. BNX81 TaxID=2980181 RepID=UPI0023DD4EC6|nr:hypothetical protein [Halorhabdus sp. BNX81]WEL21860.1 putative surface protein, possible component of pili like system [Halorhabdus sp. BNX81]
MSFRGDERAQAIQIGAVLLFAVLVIAFSLYQAFIVPTQNEQIEADHLQSVEGDMLDLRNGITTTPRSGDGRSIRVSLGTTYPARVIALNPPPPSGRLYTAGTDSGDVNVTLSNARALDDETRDYWDGTNRTRHSGGVVYAPDYNEFRDPPDLVYDNSVLSRRFADAELWASGQTLIEGRELTLVALDGTYDKRSGHTAAVDLEAISASQTDVAITNVTGENVTVQFASMRSASAWESLLLDEEQFTNQSGYVTSVTGTPIPAAAYELVTLELAQNETYDLRMAKVALGTGATDSETTYVTAVGPKNVSSNETFSAEVRDEFNNPVSGVTVEPQVERGDCDIPPKRTGEQGRVSYECGGPARVSLEIGALDSESATYRVGTFPEDTPPPSIDGPTSFDRSSSVRNFGATDVSQYVFESTVSDDSGSGLDHVSYRLLDDTGDIVTAGTDQLDGEESTDLSWYSPWFENGDLSGNLDDYEMVITVTDNAGGSTTGTIPVAGTLDEEANVAVTIDSTNSPVEEGETLAVDATVENTGDETQTQSIELDVAGLRDSESVTLDPGESQTITLEWQTASGDAGDYTANVSSADSFDTAEVTVSAPIAESVTYVSGSGGTVGGNGNSRITFDLNNGGDRAATITGLTVESVSDPPAGLYINNPGGETFAGGNGEYAARIDLGVDVDLDTNAEIQSGDTVSFELGQFRTGSGNGDRVGMKGKTVTLTLSFEDGSSREYTIDV